MIMRQLHITPSITDRENQSVERYFTEISREERITAQEEVSLAQKIRQGDQAALDKLVRCNLRFVISVAKKYRHQGLSLPDLIGEGNLGLIKAARRFDETRGFKFISFAVWWIRQTIIAAILENARVIRLPASKVGEITKINKAAAALEQQLLRPPAPIQIAEYLALPEQKILDALHAAPWTATLDGPLGDDGYALADQIASPGNAADGPLMAESFRQEIGRLLSALSQRERHIIELTYGLTGGLEMCPADISPHTGLSTERVRQIRNEAMGKLKERISTPIFAAYES